MRSRNSGAISDLIRDFSFDHCTGLIYRTSNVRVDRAARLHAPLLTVIRSGRFLQRVVGLRRRNNANLALRQRGCLHQRAAERRQRPTSEAGDRDRGGTGVPPVKSTRKMRVRPLEIRIHRAPTGREILFYLIQGWRPDTSGLTPGYHLQPLRGSVRSAPKPFWTCSASDPPQ